MNPLGTRAPAEELAGLLDGRLTLALAAGQGRHAALAGRLRAVGVDLAPAAAPRPEFRAALRTRLVAVAAVQAAQPMPARPRSRTLESAVSWSQTRRAQRGLGLAAGAMASVVAVTGVAVAGSRSLPGDPFYAVKRGVEAVELRTADGAVAKGSKHLEFAAERLKEVRALTLGRDAAFAGSAGRPVAAAALGGSAAERVRSTLADMDRETRSGSELLTAAYRESNSDAPLEILSRFAGRQTRELQALLPQLPTQARSRAETSLALVSGVGLEASRLLALGVCTGQCAPEQAAPSLPPAAGGPDPQPAPTAAAPCGCEPAATPTRTSDPQPSTTPTPEPSPAPQPTTTPAPSPSPSPTASPLPVPVPTIVPTTVPTAVPTLPVPLPTGTPSPLPLPGGVSVATLPRA